MRILPAMFGLPLFTPAERIEIRKARAKRMKEEIEKIDFDKYVDKEALYNRYNEKLRWTKGMKNKYYDRANQRYLEGMETICHDVIKFLGKE